MKSLVVGVLALAALALPSEAAAQAHDPRFFGRYCGASTFQHCVNYRVCFFLGWPCSDQTQCDRVDLLDLKADVGYREAPDGRYGVVQGSGAGRANNQPLVFNFGGAVARRGVLDGTMASNLFGPSAGLAYLSDDGLALTVNAMGHSVTLRKDACGNRPPRVALRIDPVGPNLTRGRTVTLTGTITDDEDPSFVPERLQFTSDRDGPLAGFRTSSARGATLALNTLSPGQHVLTFTATDSNGLVGSASTTVMVTNAPPRPPIILAPSANAVLVAKGRVTLRASASDPEDGFLTGGALVWSLSPDGKNWKELGRGESVSIDVPDPGSYTLKVTAVDSVGASTATQRPLEVKPNDGNTPPVATIVSPIKDGCHLVPAGYELLLSGGIQDPDDPIEKQLITWRVERIVLKERTVILETNAAQASVVLDAADGRPTEYRVVLRAKDPRGLETETSTTYYALPAAIP